MDNITKYLARVIDTLFLYNFKGTCSGILFGIFLLSVQDLLALFFPIIGLIKWYGFISFGVLLFNIKPLIKGKYVDPKIEIQLKYVREILNEGNFSNAEKKKIFRDLLKLKYLSENFFDDTHEPDNRNDLH